MKANTVCLRQATVLNTKPSPPMFTSKPNQPVMHFLIILAGFQLLDINLRDSCHNDNEQSTSAFFHILFSAWFTTDTLFEMKPQNTKKLIHYMKTVFQTNPECQRQACAFEIWRRGQQFLTIPHIRRKNKDPSNSVRTFLGRLDDFLYWFYKLWVMNLNDF